jgi:hypothetical protein
MLSVLDVSYVGNNLLFVKLSNGKEGYFSLLPYISKGIFMQLIDEKYVSLVKINFAGICWPNGQDFSANTLSFELIIDVKSNDLHITTQSTIQRET